MTITIELPNSSKRRNRKKEKNRKYLILMKEGLLDLVMRVIMMMTYSNIFTIKLPKVNYN